MRLIENLPDGSEAVIGVIDACSIEIDPIFSDGPVRTDAVFLGKTCQILGGRGMMKPTELTGRCAVPTAFSFAALLAATVAFTGIPANATTQTSTVYASAASTPRESPTQLETLVSRIALYPDDLVALVIPAATYPLQVVEAARWLEKRKKDSKLAVPENWDDSVKSLANYPEVIRLMNDDLQWTQALNDAIVSDQAGVLNAVQSYRRKVMAAGNLKSDDKQVVTVEKEVVTIVQANPQIIYVPQYEPSAMVVYGG